MQKTTFRGRLAGRLGPALAGMLATLALAGCTVGHLPRVDDGYYQLVQTNDSTLARTIAAVPRHRFYIEQPVADTLLLYHPAAQPAPPLRYGLHAGRHVVLLRREFDFDIFTLPFKVRPGREGVPAQLNTNFNAALYVGRRLDFFFLNRHRTPSGRTAPLVRNVGFGYGLFTGLGSADISPDLTCGHATVSYEGFVLHSGAAVIYDARVFNVGAAVGVDRLLGADADYWLYQQKLWVGLLFGLNLN